LVSISLFLCIDPGTGSSAVLWFRSAAQCQCCSRLVTHQEGIFCANFGKHAGGLPLCRWAWCATCYAILPGDDFVIYQVDDATYEPGNVNLKVPEEENDYMHARPGDHLFSPFECDYCTFYQLKHHMPLPLDKMDDILQVYI